MSTQVQQANVNETPQAAPVTENPAPQSAGQAGSPQAGAPAQAGGQTPPEGAAPEAAPYTANLKFKVLDKELEFDPLLAPLVKDQAIEKKLRELHEKSHGIDFVKQERDRFRQEFQTHRQQSDALNRELAQVSTFVKEGAFDKAFGLMGIPPHAVVKWAQDQLQYEQLPADQKARIDAQRRERDQRFQSQTEAEQLRTQLETQSVQFVQVQLEQVMQHPKVMDAAAKYDARMGSQGAFLNDLLSRGDAHFTRTGQIRAPQDLAVEVMRMAGLWEDSNPQGEPQAPPPPQAKPVVTAPPAAKPSIPSFQAKPASPVQKKFRSLNELKQHYNEISGSKFEPGKR